MTISWPVHVLRPQNVAFDIASRSLAAPASVSGVTQVVASDAGIWKATFGSVVIKSRNEVLAFRAIANLLEGRLGSILVPLCRAYQPIPESGGLLDEVPHSDDTFFSDDTGYVGGAMSAELLGNLPARAIVANVAIYYGGTPEPGQHFSFGERLYRIRTVEITGTSPAATTALITFRPPLREAVTVGEFLNFDAPVCRMRLASDDAMDLELALRRFGSPTVNFIEDL